MDDKKQKRLEVSVTPKKLESAIKTVTDAVAGITTRRFRRKPNNTKVCQQCDWEKICPGREKGK